MVYSGGWLKKEKVMPKGEEKTDRKNKPKLSKADKKKKKKEKALARKERQLNQG